MLSAIDADLLDRAVANAARSRLIASPNPWVGAVVAAQDGEIFDGSTQPPGGAHAEVVALAAAGAAAQGSTVYTTLEPCNHAGRTGACTQALIAAGIDRVVVGILDPDPLVSGRGVARLREAGVAVDVAPSAPAIEDQLRPYLHHRRTGRPYVVLKLAATMDGRTAAPDGTSQWITGPASRAESHRIRAHSDAICVGAGTVRADNPSLTVRDWQPATDIAVGELDPMRIVLGKAPPGAAVHPCHEVTGNLSDIVAEMGDRGIMQLMVEGGAFTAWQFHAAGLVDRYELFLAPAIMGGNDGTGLFGGAGSPTITDLWRGVIQQVRTLGDDIQITLLPPQADAIA